MYPVVTSQHIVALRGNVTAMKKKGDHTQINREYRLKEVYLVWWLSIQTQENVRHRGTCTCVSDICFAAVC